MAASDPAIIERASLDGLLDALRRRGYTVIGPRWGARSTSMTFATSCRATPSIRAGRRSPTAA